MPAFDARAACLFRTTAIYEILRGAGWTGSDPAQVALAKDLAETGLLSFSSPACGCRSIDWLVIRGAAYDAGRRLGAGIQPMFACPTSCGYTPSDPYAPDAALPESHTPFDYNRTCPAPPPPPSAWWKPLLLGAGVVGIVLAAVSLARAPVARG